MAIQEPQYSERQEEIARAKGQGLVTISWTNPSGSGVTWSSAVSDKVLNYVKAVQKRALKISEEE